MTSTRVLIVGAGPTGLVLALWLTRAARAWQAHVYGIASAEVAAACAELRLPLHVFKWGDSVAKAGAGTFNL